MQVVLHEHLAILDLDWIQDDTKRRRKKKKKKRRRRKKKKEEPLVKLIKNNGQRWWRNPTATTPISAPNLKTEFCKKMTSPAITLLPNSGRKKGKKREKKKKKPKNGG